MDTKEEFMQPGKNNKEDRMNFVKFWARYIQNHSDEEWSSQQNKLINSQLQISRELHKNKN
jgi:hypothetical protein